MQFPFRIPHLAGFATAGAGAASSLVAQSRRGARLTKGNCNNKGREDLPDLDLEVSSLHEQAVSLFVQQGGSDGLPVHAAGEFPHLRAIRVGVHVSMGARQAIRAVGSALGMEAPRVNSVARQVPLLSSPGAIENVMMRARAGHP